MCMSAPKMSTPPPPPAPPPPPTKVAKKVENKSLNKAGASKKSGAGSLTIRRPSVNTGSSGVGSNVPY